MIDATALMALARMLNVRRMTNPIEERPVFGSTLGDFHALRLEKYFGDRFPDWSRPADWTPTLVAHKLAAITDSGVIPTHLGVLLFAEQPEQYLPGAYVIIRLFPDRIEFQNPGALYNTLTVENLYAGCQPARRNQFLAGFMRDYKSPLTGSSYMEARGEGSLKLVRDSQRLSGRRPQLEQIGDATKLTIYAAKPETSHPERTS